MVREMCTLDGRGPSAEFLISVAMRQRSAFSSSSSRRGRCYMKLPEAVTLFTVLRRRRYAEEKGKEEEAGRWNY